MNVWRKILKTSRHAQKLRAQAIGILNKMQQNAFERLGKDSVIIETLVIMNVVFAAATFGLIGALIYALKKD